MKLVPHPFVRRDIDGIVKHVVATTDGNVAAALTRLGEIDTLIASILSKPASGHRLSGALAGWLVRHGDRDQMTTMVFQPDVDRHRLFLALVAFGVVRSDARRRSWSAKGGALSATPQWRYAQFTRCEALS